MLLGVSLLCLLGPGGARCVGAGPGHVCACANVPHVCAGLACLLRVGTGWLCPLQGPWIWGQLDGGHLSPSGSWYAPDPLSCVGMALEAV